jgi:hypothetical protein
MSTGKERVRIALDGGAADSAPLFPLLDYGYMMTAQGREPREWFVAAAEERVQHHREMLELHPDVDGVFVHAGVPDDWAKKHRVEKLENVWRVSNVETGDSYGLAPDGSRCGTNGEPLSEADMSAEPRIREEADIDRVLGPPPTREQVRASGRFTPLRRLAAERPDLHLSVQSASPMVTAVSACGGYVQGLTTMATAPDLFRAILERAAAHACATFAESKAAGADSTWFTCYFTGADAISPRDYEDIVWPFERDVCLEAKRQDLRVLDWYLGDLMPNLDAVLRLPIDALVLEQGRKNYAVDLGEIRRRVGPAFCLFGYGYESDFCSFNRDGLTAALAHQFEAAGPRAFIVGTPIMPRDAQPEAVEFYLREARRLTGA